MQKYHSLIQTWRFGETPRKCRSVYGPWIPKLIKGPLLLLANWLIFLQKRDSKAHEESIFTQACIIAGLICYFMSSAIINISFKIKYQSLYGLFKFERNLMFHRLSENDSFIYSDEQKYGSVFFVSVIFEYNKLPYVTTNFKFVIDNFILNPRNINEHAEKQVWIAGAQRGACSLPQEVEPWRKTNISLCTRQFI